MTNSTAALVSGGAGLAGNLAGGLLSGFANEQAAGAALPYVKKAEGNVATGLTTQQGYLDPYRMQGSTNFSNASTIAANGVTPVAQYQADTFKGPDMSTDPGVQYRMDQSQAALGAQANQQGNLFSGAQVKAAQANAQNLASQEYSNAYNRDRSAYTEDRTYGAGQNAAERTYQQGLQGQNFNQNLEVGSQGLGAAGTEAGDVGTATTQTNALLGSEADLAAKQAGGMLGSVGQALGGAGTAGLDMSKYFMAQSATPAATDLNKKQ